jgi:tripartite-type tricarboxylate transporter receptor subunit TctC
VKGGKVRPILVMSEKRSSVLPEVPTAAESGFPQATMNFWMGIEGPAKIPAPIVDRLAEGLKQMMASQEVRDQMKTVGAEPFYTTPAEFKALRDADIVKYGKLAHDLGLKQ